MIFQKGLKSTVYMKSGDPLLSLGTRFGNKLETQHWTTWWEGERSRHLGGNRELSNVARNAREGHLWELAKVRFVGRACTPSPAALASLQSAEVDISSLEISFLGWFGMSIRWFVLLCG